jgi:hypothetical protein
VILSVWIDRIRLPKSQGNRRGDLRTPIRTSPVGRSHLLFVRSSLASMKEVIMLRTLVLAGFLTAWLATGIISGIVMGRRHDRLLDRFLWSLLGAASGPLLVPLALEAGRREERLGQPNSSLRWQERPPSVLVAIDDSQEAAAAPSGGLLDRNERKAG